MTPIQLDPEWEVHGSEPTIVYLGEMHREMLRIVRETLFPGKSSDTVMLSTLVQFAVSNLYVAVTTYREKQRHAEGEEPASREEATGPEEGFARSD